MTLPPCGTCGVAPYATCDTCLGPACGSCDRCLGCLHIVCERCDTEGALECAAEGDTWAHPHCERE
jgi:hypothetical protein